MTAQGPQDTPADKAASSEAAPSVTASMDQSPNSEGTGGDGKHPQSTIPAPPGPPSLARRGWTVIKWSVVLCVAMFFLIDGAGRIFHGVSEIVSPAKATNEDDAIKTAARSIAAKSLVAPITAKWHEDQERIVWRDGRRYEVYETVDAQNSFGAMIRSHFLVMFYALPDHSGTRWSKPDAVQECKEDPDAFEIQAARTCQPAWWWEESGPAQKSKSTMGVQSTESVTPEKAPSQGLPQDPQVKAPEVKPVPSSEDAVVTAERYTQEAVQRVRSMLDAQGASVAIKTYMNQVLRLLEKDQEDTAMIVLNMHDELIPYRQTVILVRDIFRERRVARAQGHILTVGPAQKPETPVAAPPTAMGIAAHHVQMAVQNLQGSMDANGEDAFYRAKMQKVIYCLQSDKEDMGMLILNETGELARYRELVIKLRDACRDRRAAQAGDGK